MTRASTPSADELRRIEQALDALLAAMMAGDLGEAATPRRLFGATLFRWINPATLPTRAECELAYLLTEPVRAALRIGVRRLGERAFELLGSVDALLDLAERACDRDGTTWGRRMSVLNSAWDGIGGGTQMWAA